MKKFCIARSIEYPQWHNEVWFNLDLRNNEYYCKNYSGTYYSPIFDSFKKAYLYFERSLNLINRILESDKYDNEGLFINLGAIINPCSDIYHIKNTYINRATEVSNCIARMLEGEDDQEIRYLYNCLVHSKDDYQTVLTMLDDILLEKDINTAILNNASKDITPFWYSTAPNLGLIRCEDYLGSIFEKEVCA